MRTKQNSHFNFNFYFSMKRREDMSRYISYVYLAPIVTWPKTVDLISIRKKKWSSKQNFAESRKITTKRLGVLRKKIFTNCHACGIAKVNNNILVLECISKFLLRCKIVIYKYCPFMSMEILANVYQFKDIYFLQDVSSNGSGRAMKRNMEDNRIDSVALLFQFQLKLS